MDRSSRHRIWKVERLFSKAEKLRAAVLTKREQSRVPLEQTLERTFRVILPEIRCHATAVAAIVISGKPKVGEPLVRAWARTLAYHQIKIEDSTAANYDLHEAAKKIYPDIVEDPDYTRPDHWWDPSIVHGPESSRFTEIFRRAPGWLLEFTQIELDAHALEFRLPNISAEQVWGVEGLKDSNRWPLLPLGTMAAGGPVSKAAESDLSPEEQHFYRQMRDRPREEWSRSERRTMAELMKRVPLEK
jgi:hypothetical protein